MNIASKKSRKIIILIMFILFCLQDFKFIEFEGFAIKYYHLFAILLFPMLIIKRKVQIPPIKILAFFIVVVMISLCNIATYGLSSFLFNYLFVFYSLVLVMNIGCDLTMSEWIEIVKYAACVVMILIWCKNIFEIQAIISFFKRPIGHPIVSTLLGGGVNLEATYMAMLIPFFKDDKRMIVYQGASIALSIIYASRAGIVANVLCLVWLAFVYLNKKQLRNIAIVILLCMIAGIYLYEEGYLDYLISRFMNFGTETGVLGRLNMWKYAWDTFVKNPLGCGIGNSILALEKLTNNAYLESNFHNIYLQMFIDLGIVGGIYYLAIIISFIVVTFKKILSNPVIVFLFLYIIMSLIQFRGAEVIIYFFVAIYMQQRKFKQINFQ